MSSDRSRTRRPMLLALSSAILVAIVALRTETPAPSVTTSPAAAPSVSPQALPDSIGFELEYAGLGAEGVDLVWRGRVAGPVPGLVTIRMEYAGGGEDRRMPIWPVNAWLLFSADDYRSSFCAELSGSMNWQSRVMRVTGLISDGAPRGVPIEQRVYLRRSGLGGTATVHFLPWIALRTTWAQHD